MVLRSEGVGIVFLCREAADCSSVTFSSSPIPYPYHPRNHRAKKNRHGTALYSQTPNEHPILSSFFLHFNEIHLQLTVPGYYFLWRQVLPPHISQWHPSGLHSCIQSLLPPSQKGKHFCKQAL